MRLTFTVEAIAQMDPTRLGELVQDRVRKGATEIRIEKLDSVIGRLTAMGGRAGEGPPPLEVEPERIPSTRYAEWSTDASPHPLPIYCSGGCDACRDYARELGVPFIGPEEAVRADGT